MRENTENILRNNPFEAVGSVERFRKRLRRVHELRSADLPAAPQENTAVKVEETKTESQPPPSQEIEALGSRDFTTLIETLAPHFTKWLSQELAERIPVGLKAHFEPRRHVLVEELATESTYRAVETLLDSEHFLEVISDVIRADVRTQAALLQSVAAHQTSTSIQEGFPLATPEVTTSKGGQDTAAPYAGGGQDTAVREVGYQKNLAMSRLDLSPHGRGQDTGLESTRPGRGGKDTLKANRDIGDEVRSPDTKKERRNRKRRERKRKKRSADSESSSGSKSEDSSTSEGETPLTQKRLKVKKIVPLNDLFAKVVDCETYRLHDPFRLYDT